MYILLGIVLILILSMFFLLFREFFKVKEGEELERYSTYENE